MADKYSPAVQRQPLLDLVKALGCRDNALRRDECGDWRINGRRGHVYAIPGSLDRPDTPGFQIFLNEADTANTWNRAKAALMPFAELTNDGEYDGALFMDRLPTPAEAEIIRYRLKIAKRAVYSEEVLAQKREQALTARQKMGQKTASCDLDGGEPLDGPPEENLALSNTTGDPSP